MVISMTLWFPTFQIHAIWLITNGRFSTLVSIYLVVRYFLCSKMAQNLPSVRYKAFVIYHTACIIGSTLPPNVSTAICQPPNVPTAICHTNRHMSWPPFGPTAKGVDRHMLAAKSPSAVQATAI